MIVSVALWGLVYAFIEKKECSKKEKTLGQSWEITQISYSAFMPDSSCICRAVNYVNLFGKRKYSGIRIGPLGFVAHPRVSVLR